MDNKGGNECYDLRMAKRNAVVLSISATLLFVSIALIVASNRNIVPVVDNSVLNSEISYAYTVEEGKNFTLVKINGVLGDLIENTSDSIVYELYVSNAPEASSLIRIDLGGRFDFIGGYEMQTEENEIQTLSATSLLVEDIVGTLRVGQEVEVHAMVNTVADVENLCVVESCQLLIESAQTNLAWRADDFIQKIIASDDDFTNLESSLRVIFIAEII